MDPIRRRIAIAFFAMISLNSQVACSGRDPYPNMHVRDVRVIDGGASIECIIETSTSLPRLPDGPAYTKNLKGYYFKGKLNPKEQTIDSPQIVGPIWNVPNKQGVLAEAGVAFNQQDRDAIAKMPNIKVDWMGRLVRPAGGVANGTRYEFLKVGADSAAWALLGVFPNEPPYVLRNIILPRSLSGRLSQSLSGRYVFWDSGNGVRCFDRRHDKYFKDPWLQGVLAESWKNSAMSGGAQEFIPDNLAFVLYQPWLHSDTNGKTLKSYALLGKEYDMLHAFVVYERDHVQPRVIPWLLPRDIDLLAFSYKGKILFWSNDDKECEMKLLDERGDIVHSVRYPKDKRPRSYYGYPQIDEGQATVIIAGSHFDFPKVDVEKKCVAAVFWHFETNELLAYKLCVSDLFVDDPQKKGEYTPIAVIPVADEKQ